MSESHLSIHTFVDEGKITLDLFTCGVSLDYKKMKNIISGISSSLVATRPGVPKKDERKKRRARCQTQRSYKEDNLKKLYIFIYYLLADIDI